MQKELKSLWDTCVTFHGHGCGGLAVGLKYYGIEQVEEKTAHFLQEVAWNTVCEYFDWKK